MQICKKCECINIDEAKFCRECGEKFKKNSFWVFFSIGLVIISIFMVSSFSKLEPKWIDVNFMTCTANGGEMNNGVCSAKWSDARKICSTSEGRLPTNDEFIEVVKDCGGVVVVPGNKNKYAFWEKNMNDNYYRKCYEEKGFYSNSYWSSSTVVGSFHLSIPLRTKNYSTISTSLI